MVILQSSGVQVDQDVIDAFKEIKSKKSHAYVVMKIEDKKKIVVEKKGSKLPPNCSQTRNEEIFNEMKNSLGEEPRYIVFDFCFTRSNQTVSQPKLTFISWQGTIYSKTASTRTLKRNGSADWKTQFAMLKLIVTDF